MAVGWGGQYVQVDPGLEVVLAATRVVDRTFAGPWRNSPGATMACFLRPAFAASTPCSAGPAIGLSRWAVLQEGPD
jgi:hypothetical protein